MVSDIKTSNNGVPMRTGDVFYTNPAEAQAHHEKDADNNKSAENGAVDNNEKAAEEKPAAAPQEKPEGNTGNNNQQKQQNGKPQNNQNNNGKNKHNKGNKNNQNRGQAQIFPKEDKKDETIEPHDDGKPVEPVTEPTTGADLAVTPETV